MDELRSHYMRQLLEPAKAVFLFFQCFGIEGDYDAAELPIRDVDVDV